MGLTWSKCTHLAKYTCNAGCCIWSDEFIMQHPKLFVCLLWERHHEGEVSSSRRRWPCRPRLLPELVWCWHWLQHVFHLPNFQTFWRFPSPVYPTKIPLTAFLFLWRTIIYVDFSFPPLIFVSFFMFLKVCITKLMQASVIQCRAIFFSSKGKRSWSTGFTKHESNFFYLAQVWVA